MTGHPLFRQYAAALQQSRTPLGPTNPPSLLMSPASSVSSDLGSTLELPLRPRLAQHLFGGMSSASFRKSDSIDSNASTVLDEVAASYASVLIPEAEDAATPKAVSRTNSAVCAPCNTSSAPSLTAAAIAAHSTAHLAPAAAIRSGLPFFSEMAASRPSSVPSPRPPSPLQPAYRQPASPPLCRITVLPGKCAALPRIADLRSGCADGMLLLSATACIVAKRQREPSEAAAGWQTAKRMATTAGL
jgi:hypothetical protein